MRAEKRPHEWLGGVLGVLGLAPSARTSLIKQKVLKGYALFKTSGHESPEDTTGPEIFGHYGS